MIDFGQLFAAGLPPPAVRWNGFPRYNFVGGNIDPAIVPGEGLIASAERVLRREGRKLAIYNMDSGPMGYAGLREFLAGKLRDKRAIEPWDVTSRLLACKGDGGTPALEQMVAADFCTAHFDDHVRTLKQGLRHKLGALTGALEEHFGTAAEFRRLKSGIFLWVTLPERVDTAALAAPALEAGIALNPGPEWSTDPAVARHSLRLCFALAPVADLREGVAKLAEVCHRTTGVPERSANVARQPV